VKTLLPSTHFPALTAALFAWQSILPYPSGRGADLSEPHFASRVAYSAGGTGDIVVSADRRIGSRPVRRKWDSHGWWGDVCISRQGGGDSKREMWGVGGVGGNNSRLLPVWALFEPALVVRTSPVASGAIGTRAFVRRRPMVIRCCRGQTAKSPSTNWFKRSLRALAWVCIRIALATCRALLSSSPPRATHADFPACSQAAARRTRFASSWTGRRGISRASCLNLAHKTN